jgi:hypothetical protein
MEWYCFRSLHDVCIYYLFNSFFFCYSPLLFFFLFSLLFSASGRGPQVTDTYTGYIDDVSVWQKSLTEIEVTALFTQSYTPCYQVTTGVCTF